MISTMLSAALLGGVSLMSCPTDKACDTAGANVTNVALTEKSDDCSKSCDSKTAAITNVALTSGDESNCATAFSTAKTASVLAASMPAMSYRVGETDTHCSMSAQTMASEHDKPVHFVVSSVAYETEGEAKAAHEAAMTAYADSLTRVVYNIKGETMTCATSAAKACESACSTEVKYQVGPVIFDNAEDAVRAAAMAYSAMQSVAMTYEVAGEATHCSTDAANKASSCSSPVEYVVNGAHTTCSKTAGYMLTRERMAAAMNAVQEVAG